MPFYAPLLSAASTFFGTKAGIAVATAAGSAAVNAVASSVAQKQQNKAAEAAYQRQLAEQKKERDRQAAIDAANKVEQAAIDEKNRATAKADAANKYLDMNAAAQKAGLNPLTVLRATGGTGFGAYGGYGAVMRQGLVQPTISAPILSKTSVATQIGLGAVKGFIDYKTNMKANEHYDRLNELDLEQRQLDIKLTKRQLSQLYMKNNNNNDLMETPKLQGDPEIPDGFSISQESSEQHVAGGFGMTVHPSSMSAASVIEEQYGEPVSWAYGVAKAASDAINTGYVNWKGYLDKQGYKYTPPIFARNISNSRGNGNIGYVYKMHKQDQP